MACSKLTFPCDLPQIERAVSVVREREAIPHLIEAESRVVADSNPGMHGGRAACHADLVLHFSSQAAVVGPAEAQRAVERGRATRGDGGRQLRAPQQPTELAVRVGDRETLAFG